MFDGILISVIVVGLGLLLFSLLGYAGYSTGNLIDYRKIIAAERAARQAY